ncbi:MAG: FAD-binding oxidoreductase [Solirubrobacteraceae bacterium]
MRWWGWGSPAHVAAPLSELALGLLRAEIGDSSGPGDSEPTSLEHVRLAPSRLDRAARARLAEIVGARWVQEGHEPRVLHAGGKGYPDLLRMRRGEPAGAPDAVVLPDGHAQLAAVLQVCSAEGVAVVPFGGGTSVVGGVAPLRGSHERVISLDLGRLDSVLAIDARSLTVRAGAGLRGPAFEAALAAHGLTLGHYPQSFEYVTLGGCAATRSAGQASTGYGRFDQLVSGLRLAAPAGEIVVRPIPASAAGPSIRDLIVGSEGALGVISEVDLHVRPRPACTRYEGFFFESFEQGAEALRGVAQEHAAPDIARLSDESETRLSLALAGDGGVKGTLGRGYLRLRGYRGGCLTIIGWEGERDVVGARRARTTALLTRGGALAVGAGPGRAWAAGRFSGPYLRDELMGRGILVETLETAAQWSDLHGLHDAVSGALRDSLTARGTPPVVMCHISHLYESGASLYFTFLARAIDGAELEQWAAAKHAASEAILAHRGTITHHHAIGCDHAPWLEREIGADALGLLQAAKQRLDPNAVMNPGKLIL